MKTKSKLKLFKIAFTALITITVLSTAGTSITLLGEYEEDHIIGTETYTARVPTREDRSIILEDSIKLNNKFKAEILPTISTRDQEFILTPPEEQRITLQRQREDYSFEFAGEVSQLLINEEIHIEKSQISLKVEIENKRDTQSQVTASYDLEGPRDSKIFYPYAVDNQTWNYIVLTNQNHKGNSLAAITNTQLTGREPFLETTAQQIRRTRELDPGETMTLELTLRPMNIWTEENQLNYPHRYSTFLENTLVDTQENLEKEINSEETSGKTSEILSKIQAEKQPTGDGSFTTFNTVNLTKEQINSLEASVMYKELCIQEKIPCRIVIGEKSNGKFAWIEALENEEWIPIDPFAGTKTHPDHMEQYKEPKLPYAEVAGSEPIGEPYLEATKAATRPDTLNPLIYLIPIIALTTLVIVLIHFESESFIEKLTPTKIEEEPELNGEYEIISKKEEIEERTAIPIFEKIQKENGKIDIKKYAEETKYSKNLVENYVSYLRNQKHIKPKKQEDEEQ